jgi:hypothetical protein
MRQQHEHGPWLNISRFSRNPCPISFHIIYIYPLSLKRRCSVGNLGGDRCRQAVTSSDDSPSPSSPSLSSSHGNPSKTLLAFVCVLERPSTKAGALGLYARAERELGFGTMNEIPWRAAAGTTRHRPVFFSWLRCNVPLVFHARGRVATDEFIRIYSSCTTWYMRGF